MLYKGHNGFDSFSSPTKRRWARRTGLGVLVALSLAACVSGADEIAAAPIDVELFSDPDGLAPLAAELKFVSERAQRAQVELSDGDRSWRVNFANPVEGEVALPLLGMRPDTEHSIKLILDGDIVSGEAPLTYRTPALPQSTLQFPTIDIQTQDTEAMEPGLTLMSVRRRALGRANLLSDAQREFSVGWGMILALDNEGEVVWYYRSPSRTAGIEMLSNGNLLFHETRFSTREIDFLGRLQTEWYAEKRPQGPSENPDAVTIKGVQTLHHQPHETPSGTFLAFTANARVIEDYYTSELDINAPRKDQLVMGDSIIEFDREGNVLWQWDSWDHLDPFRIGYWTFTTYWWVRGFPDHLDWTHGNGLTYDKEDDAVIISLRHQDAIIKIDRKTKDIVWILGEPTDWPEHLQSKLLTPVGDLQWPYHQHNPRLTEDGNVMVFDNGLYRARPFRDPPPVAEKDAFSRGVEFRIDEESMTVEQLWSSHDGKGPDSCFASAMSDAHKLPKTGNHLVFFAFCSPQDEDITNDDFDFSKRHLDDMPYGGRIVEYRAGTREPVFRAHIENPYDLMQWEVYGGLKVDDLYGPTATVTYLDQSEGG